MPEMQCRLICHSFCDHLQQVFTGFAMLKRRGLILLSQEFTRTGVATSAEQHLKDSAGAQLRVLINGTTRVHYDLHDAADINEKNVEQCDFYFKRSFSREYVGKLAAGQIDKIFPFGLNYKVLPDSFDHGAVRRALTLGKGLKDKLLALIDATDAGNSVKFSPRVRHLESLPSDQLAPRVLFLVTAYDPYSRSDRSKQKVEEFIHVNETRAKCLRLLRRELGPRFLGGFTHNPYTVKTYPQLLVHDAALTRKKRYIALLRSFPICIATTGLHGSIGWKFAEYVALSRAIVSEKLNYEVPGDLQADRHYLEFTSPEQCAEKSVRLIEDRDARNRLMRNNALYYQSYLRPDALVLNTLLQALAKAPRALAGTALPRLSAAFNPR